MFNVSITNVSVWFAMGVTLLLSAPLAESRDFKCHSDINPNML